MCFSTVTPELNAAVFPGCNVTLGAGHSPAQPAHKPYMEVPRPTRPSPYSLHVQPLCPRLDVLVWSAASRPAEL